MEVSKFDDQDAINNSVLNESVQNIVDSACLGILHVGIVP